MQPLRRDVYSFSCGTECGEVRYITWLLMRYLIGSVRVLLAPVFAKLECIRQGARERSGSVVLMLS